MEYLLWLVWIGSSIWVVADAKSIGIQKGQIKGFSDMGPWGWFIACLILWIVAFPLYLVKRSEYIRVNRERSYVSAIAEGSDEMSDIQNEPHVSPKRGVPSDRPPPGQHNTETWRCPKCRREVQAPEGKSSKYKCRYCGEPMSMVAAVFPGEVAATTVKDKPTFCEYCGTQVPRGARFCPKCKEYPLMSREQKADRVEPLDKRAEYERSVWDSFRREYLPATPARRAQLDRRMLRWQSLMKTGLAPDRAFIEAMQEESDHGVKEHVAG